MQRGFTLDPIPELGARVVEVELLWREVVLTEPAAAAVSLDSTAYFRSVAPSETVGSVRVDRS